MTLLRMIRRTGLRRGWRTWRLLRQTRSVLADVAIFDAPPPTYYLNDWRPAHGSKPTMPGNRRRKPR